MSGAMKESVSNSQLSQHSSVDLDYAAWDRMDEVDPSGENSSDEDTALPWADSGSGFRKSVDVGKAEKQFLLSLRKPRHMAAVSGMSPSRVAGVDKDSLHTLRISHESIAKREVLAEKEDIHRMDQYSIIPPWDHKNFPKVQEAYHNRKGEHDKVLNSFRQAVITISDTLENRVIKACRDLREEHEDIDKDISAIFAKLNDDDHLRMQPWSYVEETWEKLDGVLGARTESVESFGAEMEELEEGRATTLMEEMRNFVAGLTEVSYVLKDEIARMVEAETQEINMVIIGNLLAHSECKSRLHRTDIEVRITKRGDFERRQKAWRELRHNRAISEFHTTISSKEYTNPVPRQALLQAAKEDQRARHEGKRMPIYKHLFELKAPLWSTEKVDDAREDFKDLEAQEIEHNEKLQQSLSDEGSRFEDKANAFREALRAELHTYGALAEKANLPELRNSIAEALVNPELEEMFRKSGGLKKDLQWIAVALGRKSIIYQEDAHEAKDRVEKLYSYTNIVDLLEKQGKESDRKSIQATLEKLRTGKKKDVPKRGAQLRKQLGKFSHISGLPALMKEELNSILDEFDILFPGAAPRPGSGSVNGSESAPSERPGTSHSGSISATSFGTDMVMNNLAQVRSLQNRAATVVSACELPEDLKDILKQAVLRLRQQIYANNLIDIVVADECTTPIKDRLKEDSVVQRQTIYFVVEQEKRLHLGAMRTCDFFASMTKLFEKHKEDADIIDGTLADELTDELDRFDELHDKQEKRLAKELHKLRYSPNSLLLDEYFDSALKTLRDIETAYRVHWKQYMGIASKLMPESEAEAAEYCDKASEIMRMITPPKCDAIARKFRAFQNSQDVAEAGEEPPAAEQTGEVEATIDGAADAAEPIDDGEALAEEAETEAGAEDEEDGEENDGEGEEESQELEEEEEQTPVEPEVLGPEQEYKAMVVMEKLSFVTDIENTFLNVYNREYRQQTPLFEVAKELLGAPMVEQTIEFADTDIPEAPVEALENENGQKEDPAEETPKPTSFTVATNGAPISPLDGDGNMCSSVLVVPYKFLKERLAGLRENFFSVMEGKLSRRFLRLSELTEKRETKSTSELEERIRLHWPRKGYTDVKYRQPRVYEISQHRKKLERQKRTVILRNRSHDAEFVTKMNAANEDIEEFRGKLNLMDSMLDSQTTLAALQGVVQRCKDAIAEFDISNFSRVDALRPLLDAEPNMLIESNARFLNTCLTYEEEGDYDPQEVEHCRDVLYEVDDKFHRTAQNRKNALTSLRERQEEAKGEYTQFNDHFLRTLQDLSMREGLGKKYGKPRRGAQERMRNEISQCDEAHGKLKIAIRTIKELIKLKPGSITDKRTIARRLATIMVIIRNDFAARGKYLECVKGGDIEKFDIKDIELSGLVQLGPESSVNMDDPETTLFFDDRKFNEAIEQLVQICKDETRELYEREGKLEMAGPDGVPAKLKTYLVGCQKDAKEYLTNTRIKYRDQLADLQEIGALVPTAIAADIAARSLVSLEDQKREIERHFTETYKSLRAEMSKNSTKLRPSLASPNNLQELNELCEAEIARANKSEKLLKDTLGSILQLTEKCAMNYLNELNAATKIVMKVWDTQIAPWHIIELPGDKEIEMAKERKSLKSLRRKTVSRKAGTLVLDGEIVEKEWPGLPLSDFVLKDEAAKMGEDGAADDAPEEALEDAAEDGENGEGTPTVSETITSFSTRCTRLMDKARRRSYQKYVENYKANVAAVRKNYNSISEEEQFFKFNWDKRISELRSQMEQGGFS